MSFTSAITLETGNEYSHKFALVTIQASKGIRLSLYLPSRAIESTWGGLVIGMNIAINSVWYNLGNYGNSGNVAIRNRTSSGSFFSEKIPEVTLVPLISIAGVLISILPSSALSLSST
jgi:hypothetical protein